MINIKRLASLLLTASITTSCVSTKDYYQFSKTKIEGPKVIALEGDRAPWTNEVEKRLREKGFKVKRFSVGSEMTVRRDSDTIEKFNKATARVILRIDANAPNDSMTRCFGGGFKFFYFNAELIDVQNNETIATYSNSGYSENCPPLSGTIFTDTTNMVTSAFGKGEQ